MRLAIDVGGTFTDLVLEHPTLGERPYKTSSTPQDPSVGVLTGIELIADDLGVEVADVLRDVTAIVHGTTIATNALITRTGSRVGLLTTDGFRDVLGMRESHRERQWDSRSRPPEPLVERALIRTVRERVNCDGVVQTELREEDVVAAARFFAANGVEAVAVAYVFSCLERAHEQRTREILRAELPDAYLSISSELTQAVGLYERTSTIVVNAYVGSLLRSYLDRLEERLATAGYTGPVLIMQSNGGVVTLQRASQLAVNSLLSGPAGAPVAAARHVHEPSRLPKAVAIDMGGTSFEAALVVDGAVEVRRSGDIAGARIATPMLDISTIGAGGGSLAWITPGGALRVGPRSAGAQPGPACYGRGGTEPTVTDADLVLGYLNAASIGQQSIRLDVEAAWSAVGALGDRLGLSVLDAAAAIHATINATMADSLRLATVRKGLDPREFAVLAAGGAGPLHAAEVARDLEAPIIIVPRDASVLCAAGMLNSDVTRHYVRTFLGGKESQSPAELESGFEELERRAAAEMEADGFDPASLRFARSADLRFHGQIHEIETPLPDGVLTEEVYDALVARFAAVHDARYGHTLPGAGVEVVNVRLRATHPLPRGTTTPPVRAQVPAAVEHRSAWFGGEMLDAVPVHQGAALAPGAVIDGPALVDEPTTTVVVPVGFALRVAGATMHVLHLQEHRLDEALRDLQLAGSGV